MECHIRGLLGPCLSWLFFRRMTDKWDTAVVGGGIIGLSIAWELHRWHPGRRLLLLEKESTVASHQSRHNSGVVHSGIYYPMNSLKARLCVAGRAELLSFLKREELPYEQCGKVIVALREDEREALGALYRQGCANGVSDLELGGGGSG